MVGFVPCTNKHRAKAASWQCFAYNLTLTRNVCSELSAVPKSSGKGPARYLANLRDKTSAIEMEIDRNIDELGKRNGRSVESDKRRTNNVSFRGAKKACSDAHRSSSGYSISGIVAFAHAAINSLGVRSSQRRNHPATSDCTDRR